MIKRFAVALAVGIFAACASNTVTDEKPPTATESNPYPTLSLAEAIYVVHNLDSANDYFQSEMGFVTDHFTALSPHTQARTILFQNRSAIQLLTSNNGDDVLARLVADSLSEREGVAFIGLKTSSLPNTMAIFRKREIPFTQIQAPDGRKKAIFFPDFPRLRMFYFFESEADMSDTTQKNEVVGLSEAWIAVDDFYALEDDFAALGVPETSDTILQPFRSTAKKIQFGQGTLLFVKREHLEDPDKMYLRADTSTVLGLSLNTVSIEATAKRMSRRKFDYATTRYNNKACILIPPKSAMGSWLEFARQM
jgi:hypothetical protein